MTFEPIWGSIIAWYLFLAGLGAGAFATSAFLGWRHPEATSMRKVGHVIAPVVVAVGLVLLMVDAEAGLHNPLRFFYLLSNFGSVMTWGVVFLSLFMVVAIAALVLDILKKNVPTWLDIVGVALAFAVAVYTGALLGVCNTFPLWNNALLPILFLVSAMSAGAASVLLVAVVKHADEFNRVGVLKKFHFCLPIIELMLVASLSVHHELQLSCGLRIRHEPGRRRVRPAVLARLGRHRSHHAHRVGDLAFVLHREGVRGEP